MDINLFNIINKPKNESSAEDAFTKAASGTIIADPQNAARLAEASPELGF